MARSSSKSQPTYEDFIESLDLVGVFLGGLKFDLDRDVFPSGTDDKTSNKIDSHAEIDSTDGMLRAVVDFTLSSRTSGERKPFNKARISYEVLFGADSVEVPSEFQEQFKHNMVHLCWPYLRELMDTLGMRAAVPIPPIPLLTGRQITTVTPEKK